MNEAQWNVSNDPDRMLEFLRGGATSWGASVLRWVGLLPNTRKFRLFAYLCCRRVWHLLAAEPDCQRAVEVAERCAEGLAGPAELRAAWEAAHARRVQLSEAEKEEPVRPKRLAVRAVEEATETNAYRAAERAALLTREAANSEVIWNMPGGLSGQCWLGSPQLLACRQGQMEAQCSWLRDIFGPLPFRTVSIEPSLLSWNNGVVVKLAQGIYDERAFHRLPLLADALEEAGCDNEEILSHCRSQSDHVRGCWLIDLILEKA
jgi:hypothetical protein